MTPADLIETALRENMRIRLEPETAVATGISMLSLSGAEAEDAARIAVDALKAAGMAVISAEDLRLAVRHSYLPEDDPARAQKVLAARDRLRAAFDASLPPEEETTDADR